MFETPRTIAPASASLLTATAVVGATTSARWSVPDVFGIPSTANDSLIDTGTPWNGPRSGGSSAFATASSAAPASSRAASKRVATSALTDGLRRSISAMCASTTSRDRSRPLLIAVARSVAERSVSAVSVADVVVTGA